MRRVVLVLLLILAFAACNGESKPRPLDVAGQKLYPVTGKIVSRSSGDNTVKLDHEAIPGFMEAMTMDYSVRGAKVDSLPSDGSRITAKLHVANDAYWLTDVKKVP
jgi:protein SCO1/2